MIIYAPHRGGLKESMKLAKEFETIQELESHLGYKIIILGEPREDARIGWKNRQMVCVKMEEYDKPQCIGYCATEY